MTLDEAIEHCKDVARDNRAKAEEEWRAFSIYPFGNVEESATFVDRCDECAEQHEQLAQWLEELKEYEELEEKGLLLKLPCKLGDENYWIDDEDEDGNKGLCVKGKSYVEAIGVDKDGFLISTGDGSWDRPNKSRWCFLTKEEAEKELKRLECAENE